jgi:hypothetical protein
MTVKSERVSCEVLAEVVLQFLLEGKAVEIDGIGTFHPEGTAVRFEPHTRPRVFLAYVQEDAASADRLFDDLAARGFDPWMDRRKLLPGQNWPRAIEEAIDEAQFFIPCFSRRSVSKSGGFQAEIRYALDCARRLPLDEVFVLPVRLDDCRVPARILREIHHVDLFPRWDQGLDRLFAIMLAQASPDSISFVRG